MKKHPNIITITLICTFITLLFGSVLPFRSMAQMMVKTDPEDKQTKQEGVPFLYLPFRVVNNTPNYMDVMTSIFDHSNPNYTKEDNKIIMFNGGIFDDNCKSIGYNGEKRNNCSLPIQSFTDETWEYPRQFYNGHDGYDWAVSGDVVAAANGVIVFEGWWSKIPGQCNGYTGLGYMVIIDHENDYRTIYGHMLDSSSPFHEGQRVYAGQTIGIVGNTTKCGTSTGKHLHFQVEHWQWQNEDWYLTDPFGWDHSAGDDPLLLYNGESSQNLWINGSPTPYGGTPGVPPSVPLNGNYMGGAYISDSPPDNPSPSPSFDDVTFIADITIPDGTVVTPSESLVKTWRVRNSGTSTWDGYKLVFQSGNQMGASSSVNIPYTAPGQTVDISVNMTTPATEGQHVGYWQLQSPQGTYFGSQLWVKIKVQEQSNYPITLTADPTSPANTDSVQFHAHINNFPDFRAMRLKIDGKVAYEIGAPTFTYNWSTNGYASGTHSIVVEVASQTDSSWSYPEIKVMTYVLEGNTNPTNHSPHPPNPTSPNNWHVYYSGNTAQLCAQNNGDPDGDSITSYYFDIFGSAQVWNSGWVSNSCVTTPAMGPYNYQWRVKVRDGYGAESDWSDSWHYTLVNPSLSITDFYFEPQDANKEEVKIRACTTGQGGIGITMRVSVNEATDGSDSGEWRVLKELGVPCFNAIDAPMWRTLKYGDGSHLVRVEARGSNAGWDGAAVAEQVYSLPHRRPDGPVLTAPRPLSGNWREPIYLNSRTITFKWEPRVNVDQYTLYVSDSSAPRDDPTPIFQESFNSNVTEHTVTFTQDHPTLYWQIETTNDKGSNASGDQLFGIDRTPPLCNIEPLPSITYENVFQVLWSSSDSDAGSRFIDVQYQDGDRGEWQDWLVSLPVAQTFDLFNGQAGHAYQFRCRATDHAGNISQYSTPSSYIQVDPTARPTESWWDSNYSQKRSITILNNDTNLSLPVDYPVHLRFDNTTTPSSTTLFNGSESPVKCDDLRIVHNNTAELSRYIPTCTSDLIEIWFRNQESINPATSNSTAYRLYYGYDSASNPPNEQTDVWYPQDDANTVGLWFLSEGSGTTITDHSGYGNHGSRGALTWTDDVFGKALVSPDHERSNGAYIPGSSSMGSSAFTLEFFIKRNDLNGGYIAGMGTSGNDRERMRLSIEGPGTIKFQVDPAPGGASDTWAHSVCLPDLEWQHVAVTFDGNRTSKIYCGGVLAGSGTSGDPGISNLNFDLYFGSDFSDARRFKGVIDQVRLSNIVRTSFPHAQFAEIKLPPSMAAGDLMSLPTTGHPDLTIQTVRTYPNLTGGFIVEAVVQNLGSANTHNGFYTDLYIDHIPTGAGDYTHSLQFWVNDPIAVGATVTLTTVITDWQTSNNVMLSSMTAGSELTGTLYGQVDSSGVISETNNSNNIYSIGTEICLANPDAYEGDEIQSSASLITLGEKQNHNIDHLGDEDWVQFETQEGKTYILRTSNLATSADTYIYLYDTDRITLLTSNDDYNGTLASNVEWTAPTTGTYYALVKHWNPNVGGCSTSYTLTFAERGSKLFLPMIVNNTTSTQPPPTPLPTPIPTPMPSPTPIPNHDWTHIGSGGPSARSGQGMVLDAANNKLVIHGGTCSGFACSDTWTYGETGWQEITGVGPSAREEGIMAYDGLRQKTVLFGGHVWAGGYLADTWEFNGASWSQISTATSPSARASQAMAYDSNRNRIVLFGGWADGTDYLGDTWEYDGTNWQQITTTNSPIPRRGARMIFDPETNQIILFGGLSPSLEVFNETWAYDGQNWTLLTTTSSPSARYNHQMVYDPTKSTTVLFGGYRLDTGAQIDTWEFSNSDWQQATLAYSLPATWLAGMAYYPPLNGIIMHGGNSPNQNDLSEEMWLYSSTP